MMKFSYIEKTQAKRLVHLYLLDVEIGGHYPMIIGRIFEFLDFCDSKDITDVRELKRKVSKYRTSKWFVCDIIYGHKHVAVNFYGVYVHNFLNSIREDFFMDSSDSEITKYIRPFIFCILEKKGIRVDSISI